jgi:hypothetical protein
VARIHPLIEHVDRFTLSGALDARDHDDDRECAVLLEVVLGVQERLAELGLLALEGSRLRPWYRRLEELDVETDSLDDMLTEIEMKFSRGEDESREQLSEFGTLLSTLVEHDTVTEHRIIDARGRQYAGSWEEIVRRMRDEDGVTHTVQEWMAHQAHRVQTARGIEIPTHDAESFLRGSANAGLLRIVR